MMTVGLTKKHRLGRCFLLLLFAVVIAVTSPFSPTVPAQDSQNDPLEGEVVNLAQVGSDFFVQLDLDDDGEGDVWVKLIEGITDTAGNSVEFEDIGLGTRIRVIEYQDNEVGFIVALQAQVIGDTPTNNPPTRDPNIPTTVNVYARVAGAPRPNLELFGTDRDAWICRGDQIEVFWITTPDVTQVSLGESLGIFPANNRGGILDDGLIWGAVVAQPLETLSIQITSVDGNFDAGGSATVFIFGQPQVDAFQADAEASLVAELVGNTTRTNQSDDWIADVPGTRVSNRLGVTDIKPIKSASGSGFNWRVRKDNADGTVDNFNLSSTETFQHPFITEQAPEPLMFGGKWTFTTSADVSDNRIEFVLKPTCS